MEQQQFEQIVQAITEEIIGYLGAPKGGGLTGLEIDELVCPGCNQNCAERCAIKTRKVVEAGAARISAGSEVQQIDADIARLIDHTLLKPDASRDELRKLCLEAVRFGFASVCINPCYVPLAAELVRGTNVKVCTVVGFPLGATLPQVKIYEAEEVLKLGAQEIDMVINVGALKSRQDDVVESDIRGVVEASHRGGGICKVIIEAALLTIEEKVRAVCFEECRSGFRENVHGIQYRRGHGGRCGADARRRGSEIGVKAAGGVRSLKISRRWLPPGPRGSGPAPA